MFKLTVAFTLLGCVLAATVQQNYNNDGRIVGGEPTTIEKFPYQVALETDGSIFCGGSLYSQDIVVTAAHCLEDFSANQITVRLGSTILEKGGETIRVKAFKYHEGYDTWKLINDVGVIKLSTPVRLTDKVNIIKLATDVPKSGTDAVVTGWGTSSFSSESHAEILQKVEVKIVSNEDCRSDDYNYGAEIFDKMICGYVEGGGKDACKGDSGGPLAAGGKLVGIVSWGRGCGWKNYPGVYSSVPELREWIIYNAAELSKL